MICPKFFLTHQRPYRCLTDRVIFFYQVFDLVHQWPHHGLADRFFFIFFKVVSGHTMVCQTGFFLKDILDWDVNDHTTASQTGSIVWSLTS